MLKVVKAGMVNKHPVHTINVAMKVAHLGDRLPAQQSAPCYKELGASCYKGLETSRAGRHSSAGKSNLNFIAKHLGSCTDCLPDVLLSEVMTL